MSDMIEVVELIIFFVPIKTKFIQYWFLLKTKILLQNKAISKKEELLTLKTTIDLFISKNDLLGINEEIKPLLHRLLHEIDQFKGVSLSVITPFNNQYN